MSAGGGHGQDHDHDHDHAHEHDHGDAHGSHGHRGHDHRGHAHGPGGHVHAPADFGRAFALGIALNVGFVVIEAGYGYAANSMALIADAGHNLSDVLGLVVAWIAAIIGKRKPTERYSWGWGHASILAALFNALALLVAVGAIAWEAVDRLRDPQPAAGWTMIVVAAIGIAINGATAWLFAAGGKDDINIRGAFLHMLADAAVSAGVVVAGLLMLATGWLRVDPIVSLLIAGVILWSTWDLLRQSWAMALGAAPAHVDVPGLRGFLASREGVASLHDLHVWPMSTTQVALSAHLVMPQGHPGDDFLRALAGELKARFRVDHATLQIERDGASCPHAAHAA